ncbi:MAG: GNAT family N-acetyltransferase [Ilumatobacteraceae bacterium]
MSINVTHNEAAGRYELSLDERLVGVAEYSRHGDVLDFTHTEITAGHGGQGLGTTLVAAALDDVSRRSLGVVPHCWFVRDHIVEHPAEYLALVPAERRAEFRLPDA